jgi:hypothetical protein
MRTVHYGLTASIALALFGGAGCVAVSMHTTRDVLVTLAESSSWLPVQEAPIRVTYTYDSYGVFRVLRTPAPLEAKTDVNGKAVVRLADYGWTIALAVDLSRKGDFQTQTPYFLLNKKLVRDGGSVESIPIGRFPRLHLVLEPSKGANKPAAGKAAATRLVAIRRHYRGLPEPERSAMR